MAYLVMIHGQLLIDRGYFALWRYFPGLLFDGMYIWWYFESLKYDAPLLYVRLSSFTTRNGICFCFHLRMLYGQLQNTHRIYLSFLGMICLAVTFDLNKKNSQYFFSLKFQYFSIFFSFHRGVRDKEINKNEIKKMTTIIQPSEAVPFSYWLLHHKNFSLSHPSISSSMLPLYIK